MCDGLLETGTWEVQLAVLAAGQRLCASAAPIASRSAAAATQVEWLLQAVQALASQLAAPVPTQAASSQPARTPDQARALAGQLVNTVLALAAHDVRLPRLQNALQACLERLLKCKPLLTDQQLASVTSLLKHNGSGARPPATAMPGTPSPLPHMHMHIMPQHEAAAAGHVGAGSHAAAAGAGTAAGVAGAAAGDGLGSRFAQFRNRFKRVTTKSGADDSMATAALAAGVLPGACQVGSGQQQRGASPGGGGSGMLGAGAAANATGAAAAAGAGSSGAGTVRGGVAGGGHVMQEGASSGGGAGMGTGAGVALQGSASLGSNEDGDEELQ